MLVAILCIFSLSYILRSVFDLYESYHVTANDFAGFMTRATLAIPFSLAPILLMTLLHRSNLRARKAVPAAEDVNRSKISQLPSIDNGHSAHQRNESSTSVSAVV